MQQFMVLASSLFAALSTGCSVGYPGVLMQQLSSNDSMIQLELDTGSWIGSIHGLTGIPTVIIPAFMHWKGRKITFIIVTLITVIGWILASTANSLRTILIGESIIGFGSHSVISTVLMSISEMISPEFRNVAIVSFFVVQALSLGLVEIAGKYLHWKTVSLIMSLPVGLAMLIGLFWPESPSWLAYKGQYEKCAKDFNRLRGTSARMELKELILAQKENAAIDKCNRQSPLKYFYDKLKRRDFWVPALHIFLLQTIADYSGILVVLVYSSKIIRATTQSSDAVFYGTMIINCSLFFCFIFHLVLLRFVRQRIIFFTMSLCMIVSLLGVAIANYLQTIDLLSKDSLICLYFLVGHTLFLTLGVLPVAYTKCNELMPVKHRDIGGPLSLVFACILDTSSLKLAPYLFISINIWGVMSLFAICALVCLFLILKFVPETHGKTLQQLEDYYTYGSFDSPHRAYNEKCLFQASDVKQHKQIC